MITQTYLAKRLQPLGYTFDTQGECPVFWRQVPHTNATDRYAVTIIMVTLDQYTVTIEGFNENLIRRAVAAGAIQLPDAESWDALRDVLYDNTHDDVSAFERLFGFMEKQLDQLCTYPPDDPQHQQAVKYLQLMVEAANAVE